MQPRVWLGVARWRSTLVPDTVAARELSSSQAAQMTARHSTARAEFAASRLALRAIGTLGDNGSAMDFRRACERATRGEISTHGFAASFAHDGVGVALLGTNYDGSLLVGADVIDMARFTTLLRRRSAFVRRWVPTAEAASVEQAAFLWGVREVCVKLIGDNRAVDMASRHAVFSADRLPVTRLEDCINTSHAATAAEVSQLTTPVTVSNTDRLWKRGSATPIARDVAFRAAMIESVTEDGTSHHMVVIGTASRCS
jgi:phosphopantetheinyl transferase (holo-ACP synthase)